MSFEKLRGQWVFLTSQPGFQAAPVRVLSRLLGWRALCWFKKAVTVKFPGQGLAYYLPPQWHGSSKLLYVFRDAFEPDLAVMNPYLGPGKVMVDVGANFGIFSLNASRLVGATGRVVAFEPAQATYSVFQKNLALNNAGNVKPMRLALADKPGSLKLYHDLDPTRNSLAPGDVRQDFEEVQVRTLDDVLAELGVPRADFVKIDVEGADELVCRGAQKTLRASFPPVFFETNSGAAVRMGLKRHGTSEFLQGLGYELHSFEDGKLTKLSPGAVPEGNLLALHPAQPAAGRILGNGFGT